MIMVPVGGPVGGRRHMLYFLGRWGGACVLARPWAAGSAHLAGWATKATGAPGGTCDMSPHGLPAYRADATPDATAWAAGGGHVFLPAHGRPGLLLELSGLPRLRQPLAGRVT